MNVNIKRYNLGSDKAKEIHNSIINGDGAYSLTVTLNPFFNSLPVHEQYNKLSRELVKVFKEIGSYYNELMMTPEFTKDYNVHFHCYLKLPRDEDYQVFEQNWKKAKMGLKTIGRMYKLKMVDEVSPELKNYPFKDNERTIKYSQIDNCLFTPNHYVFRSKGNILRCDNTKKGIDLTKFIDFVNSQKIL